MEWANEDVLLESCLRNYPDNNFMVKYGIGTRKLYAGHIAEAHAILLEAHSLSPGVAEPLVLLAQLHWKYDRAQLGPNTIASRDKAIEYLRQVKALNKRGEFLTNLGVLLRGVEGPEARQESEHASLLAEVRHSLQPGSPMLGTILHNAACTRLLSNTSLYGSVEMAQDLAQRAARTDYPLRVIALHNLALVHAIQGNIKQAVKAARESLGYANAQAAPITARLLSPEAIVHMETFQAPPNFDPAGKVAIERCVLLNVQCMSTYLWF
jgi:tetratricopeptide (TPR) repeat protein